VLAALAAFASQAAVIYKWTDSEGVIHYSDQAVPGAEKIYTNAASTPKAPTATPSQLNTPISLGAAQRPKGLGYSILSITSPTPEQTFFGDDTIGVALALEPTLQLNHAVTWHLNGRELDDQGSTATQFALPHLDRGTYAIAATVTDRQTGESQSTESVTFYVRQPSTLSPLRKP
jgi:hypothetical protein